MPDVSVIIPTYNNAAFLSDAIDSILSQSYRDFEIIVVDDGSTDSTGEILSRYAEKILAIRQENQGPAAARNRGIALAHGKYLSFLDADDLYLPDKLKIQTEFLDAQAKIDLVYSDGWRFRATALSREAALTLSKTGEVQALCLEPQRYADHLIPRNLFPIHASLVRRCCVMDVGGFDETLTACEDWDLWYRIAERHSLAFLDARLVKYRVTPGSNSTDLLRNLREARKVFLKIGLSERFQTAPTPILQDYYYQLGLTELALENAPAARSAFRKALTYVPRNQLTFLAYCLTTLFGKKAYSLYRVKRWLMGKRGVIQV
jgi:glycosyltransferase involved in cell wall biosynthesis